LNSALKHLAERALVAFGVERFTRRRLSGRTLVLAYHNIVPDGEYTAGDASLHLPQHEFARQLDALAESHYVVPLDDLDRDSTTQRPRVIITFDDAYDGAVSAGVEELRKRQMPATIFVAPAMLGSTPWWDALADPKLGAVPDDVRRHALERLHGEAIAIFEWTKRASLGFQAASKLPRIATEAELKVSASKPGITLASHTWAHQNLASLGSTALESELRRPLQWLQPRFPAVVPWLSYPYGLFNDSVQAAARNAGYAGAFRIDGGWMPRSSPSSYALPRLNIPAGLSLNGFRLRLAGL
jgi:peptidoglycan/xylan/chitin deacetylase (PgdA/CDA1 family)